MSASQKMWVNVGGNGVTGRTENTVFPPHLVYSFYMDVVYNSIFFIATIVFGLNGVTGRAGEGFTWWIWMCLVLGIPWWSTGACALVGGGIAECKCCSPVGTIQAAFALLLISGIVVLFFNVLGTVTTEGAIGAMFLDSRHTPGIFFYVMWIPGSSVVAIGRIVFAICACMQRDAVEDAQIGPVMVLAPVANPMMAQVAPTAQVAVVVGTAYI
jgi:hypothetical protein